MAESLRWFRYRRAIGGVVNDGDGLVVELPFSTEPARDRILERSGLVPATGLVQLCGEWVSVSERQGCFEVFVTDNRVDGEKVFHTYAAGLEAWERAWRLEAALGALEIPLRSPTGSRDHEAIRP